MAVKRYRINQMNYIAHQTTKSVQNIFDLFDAYAIRARIYPLIPLILPIYSVFVVGAQDDGDAAILLLIASPFVIFALTQYVRDKGKKLEKDKKFLASNKSLLNNPMKYNLSVAEVNHFFSDPADDMRIRKAINQLKDDKVIFDRNCIYGYRRNLAAIRNTVLLVNFVGIVMLWRMIYSESIVASDAIGAIALCAIVSFLAWKEGSENLVRQSANDYIHYLIKRSL